METEFEEIFIFAFTVDAASTSRTIFKNRSQQAIVQAKQASESDETGVRTRDVRPPISQPATLFVVPTPPGVGNFHVSWPLLIGESMPAAVSPTLQQAHAALDAGQPRDVIQLLTETGHTSSQTHGDLESLSLLGIAYHDCGQPMDAADALERASLIGPVSDQARIALASSYAELRRIDLARELYLQLALSRRLPHALMLQVAAGLAAIDAPQVAMKVCEWIIEKDDTIAQAYYDMGRYSASSGNELYLTEALTHRAVQLDPGNVHYRIGLVSLMIQFDRDDEAIIALGSINADQIATATCDICLSRVAGLLRRSGNETLARVCNQRVNQLDELNEPSGSSNAKIAKRNREIQS